MKKIIIGVIALVVLVVAAAAILPFAVDLNKYKGRILEEVKPYAGGREIDFQNVELTILTGLGVEIDGLVVGEGPGFPQGEFLKLESLAVKVQLLPLLRKEIRVKDIILDHPEVSLIRKKDGVFNFSNLAGSEKPVAMEPAEPRKAEPGSPAESGPGMLARIVVNRLEINDGKIIYQDSSLFPEGSPLTVDALDVKIRNLALSKPVSLDISAGLFSNTDQNFHFSGVVGPVGEKVILQAVPFDLSLKLDALSVSAIPELLKNEIFRKAPYQVLAGVIGLQVKADGSLQDGVNTQSDLKLDGLVLQESAMGGGKGRGPQSAVLQISLDEKAVVNHFAQTLDLRSATLSVNGNRIHVEGRLMNYLKNPGWNLSVRTEGLKPGTLIGLFPMLSGSISENLQMDGPVEMNLRSEGTQASFQAEANAELSGLHVRYKDVFQKPAGVPFSLACKVGKEGPRIALKGLHLQMHSLAMDASGEVTTGDKTKFGVLIQSQPVGLGGWGSMLPSISAYGPDGSLVLRGSVRGTSEDLSVNLQVSSDRIGFLVPDGEGGKEKKKDTSGVLESVALQAQARKQADRVQASASVDVKKGQVMSIPFGNFASSIQYSGDRISIQGLGLNVFQGEIQGSGSYGTGSGQWSFRPVLRGISVGDILAGLTEYKNLFSGTLAGDFLVDGGRATGGKTQLAANGKFRLANGELNNFNLVGDVLRMLLEIQDVAKLLKGVKGEIQEHESTKFDWMEGDFNYRDATLVMNNLQFHNLMTSRATNSDAVFTGMVALDKDLLDLKGKVILSERDSAELARQADVLNALINTDKRMVFPVTLKGTIRKPVPFVDTQYVVGAITRYYARKGIEKGIEALQEKVGLPKDGSKGSGKPVEDLLKKWLK